MDEIFDEESSKLELQAMIDALPGEARDPGKRFLGKLLEQQGADWFMEFVDMVEARLEDGSSLHKNDLKACELELLRSTPPVMTRREALQRLTLPVAATLAGGGHAINAAIHAPSQANADGTTDSPSIVPGVVTAALGVGAVNSVARDLSLSFRIRNVQKAVDQLSLTLGNETGMGSPGR